MGDDEDILEVPRHRGYEVVELVNRVVENGVLSWKDKTYVDPHFRKHLSVLRTFVVQGFGKLVKVWSPISTPDVINATM